MTPSEVAKLRKRKAVAVSLAEPAEQPSKKPKQRTAFSTSQAEAREIGERVRVVDVPGKGKGVRAARKLPEGTFVGVMPGFLYTEAEYRDLVDGGELSDKWGMEVSGKQGTRVLSPQVRKGGDDVYKGFQSSIGHLFNEPGPRQKHVTCSWVHNHTKGKGMPRLELWTNRQVPEGRELTVSYGGKYRREYPTPALQPPNAWDMVWDAAGRAVWKDPTAAWAGSVMSSASGASKAEAEGPGEEATSPLQDPMPRGPAAQRKSRPGRGRGRGPLRRPGHLSAGPARA